MSRGYFNETVTPALHFKAVLSSFVSTLKYFPSVSILPDLTIYFSNSFFSHSCLYWNTECTISSQLGSLFVSLPFFYVLCVNLLSQVVYLPDPARKQYFWGFIAPNSSAESNLTSLLHSQKQRRNPQRRTENSTRSSWQMKDCRCEVCLPEDELFKWAFSRWKIETLWTTLVTRLCYNFLNAISSLQHANV